MYAFVLDDSLGSFGDRGEDILGEFPALRPCATPIGTLSKKHELRKKKLRIQKEMDEEMTI